jgi:hypothetical protein
MTNKHVLGKVICGCYTVVITVCKCVYCVEFLAQFREKKLKNSSVIFAISVYLHVTLVGLLTRFHEICLLANLLKLVDTFYSGYSRTRREYFTDV